MSKRLGALVAFILVGLALVFVFTHEKSEPAAAQAPATVTPTATATATPTVTPTATPSTEECNSNVYDTNDEFEATQLAICQEGEDAFNNVPAKTLHKDGRVVNVGLHGTPAEKLSQSDEQAMQDPVVTASILHCYARHSYSDAELSQLARSKAKGERHLQYWREVRDILAEPGFKLEEEKQYGTAWNEGRMADGTMTSSPTTHNGEPATVAHVPNMSTRSGRDIKDGKYVTLDRCRNCQREHKFGVPTEKPCEHNCERIRVKDPSSLDDKENGLGTDGIHGNGNDTPYWCKHDMKCNPAKVDHDKSDQKNPHTDVDKLVTNKPTAPTKPPVKTPPSNGGSTSPSAPAQQDQGGNTVQQPSAPPDNHQGEANPPAGSSPEPAPSPEEGAPPPP